MARFLLDTNACIEILRGRNPIFVQRFREHQGEQPAICTVVWAELLVGARLSADPATARRRLDVFAELPCPGFSRAAAEHYSLQAENTLSTCAIVLCDDYVSPP
jgi:tRNA(fMet)-specific endonuclease VapC